MDKSNYTPECQLVASLKKGSTKAFNTIYQLYAKKLLCYIASATNNKEDAEEIVHDIFMGLWKNHKNLDPATDLSKFLFHIAYKRRIDFFRRSVNAPIYEDYMLFQNELVSEDHHDVEYNEFCVLFNTALEALPQRLQTFLVLSRIKGLSNEDIAARLNVSEKTVRNGISLGLKLLKKQLETLSKSPKI